MKLPTQGDDMAMQDPMTGGDPMMGGDMPMQDPMMGGDPMMGMPMDGGQNQFDTNFDAGVEADENADPKKYIQQLTGKLSQSLRNYNNGQPQADADLNKYVAGMIIKQAIDGLSPDDVQEVLSKVKSNDDMEQPQSSNDQAIEGQEPMDMPMDGQQPQFDGMESRQRSKSSKKLNETLTLNDEEDSETLSPYRGDNQNKRGYKTMPFRL